MSKIQKSISSATAAAFWVVAVAQPIAVYAAESGSMIDKSQKQVESAQQQQNPEYQQIQQQQQQQIQQVQAAQQNFQQYLSPGGTVNLSRQTIYDATSGQLITLIQNNLGQVFAYSQSGQQIAVQQAWLNNISFPQNINYSPVGINGNVAGGGNIDSGTASISQTKAAQLSAVLSAIKSDSNLNAVGKIAKALLALEAIKENNQIIRQQYLAQQKAKVQAQAAEQQKIQQAAQQPKAAVQQKQNTPANAKKGDQQTEYVSVLRDSTEETGGTTAAVTINYSPSANTQQDVRETPLSLDLIGKVASISGSTVTLQDTKGQQIDVDAPDHNLQEGNYINVQGTALSGADGNIYIVKDPESGMDVSLDTIDQNTYNQKAAQQEQDAQEWASDHADAGLAGVNEEMSATYASPTVEEEGGGSNWTLGKVASLAAIGAGTAMMGFAIAGSTASGGTAIPLTAPLFQIGLSIAGGGAGTLFVQETYQENTEEMNDKFAPQLQEIQEKADSIREKIERQKAQQEE